jgi:hypothetical protein
MSDVYAPPIYAYNPSQPVVGAEPVPNNGSEIKDFLIGMQMEDYFDRLFAFGVERPLDLKEVTDAEFQEMEVKPLHVKRMRKAIGMNGEQDAKASAPINSTPMGDFDNVVDNGPRRGGGCWQPPAVIGGFVMAILFAIVGLCLLSLSCVVCERDGVCYFGSVFAPIIHAGVIFGITAGCLALVLGIGMIFFYIISPMWGNKALRTLFTVGPAITFVLAILAFILCVAGHVEEIVPNFVYSELVGVMVCSILVAVFALISAIMSSCSQGRGCCGCCA